MSSRIILFADFNNTDLHRRIRLNTNGTFDDLTKYNITLKQGLEVLLTDDELEVIGIVEYSEEEKIWVAKIDWENIMNL